MIYIMSQGEGSRWNSETIPYKQFIPVGNTTIVERTINMVKSHEFFVVCSGDFAMYFKELMPYISLREPTQDILSGIVETIAPFQNDFTILLGDVVFSKKTMEYILKTPVADIGIFGRQGGNVYTGKEAGEIFAIKISKFSKKQFTKNCMEIKWSKPNPKLWDYYRVCGCSFFNRDKDWTDDIDSFEEYNIFGKKIVELAEEEDEN